MFSNPYASPGYVDTLLTHHRVTTEIYIMTNERRILFDVSSNLISGQVDVDADGEVSRSGTITLLDPANVLSNDFNGGGYGFQSMNRMIQIVYRVWTMDMTASWGVPIFTGPITKAERNGVTLDMEFKGLEVLCQYGQGNDYTWPTGWPRSQVIMNAVYMTSGENQFWDHSGGGNFLGQPWSVLSGENLWERLKELSDSIACNIYFRGDGILWIRPKYGPTDFSLDSRMLTEEPELRYDNSMIKNVVRVEGATIPGPDVKMVYEIWPPANHPWSPQSLARYGINRTIYHQIKDDSLNNWQDIIATANANLGADLRTNIDVTAVSPVLPFLEEFDVININYPKLYATVVLKKFTIPLVGDAEMSLNFNSSSSSAVGISGGRVVSNKGAYGRFGPGGGKHGPSGAYSSWGHYGEKGTKKYEDAFHSGHTPGESVDNGKKNKGKKKNKHKNKGKK